MPVTHVNRKRDTYYLQAGKTKTGTPRYWFSKSTEGDLVDAIPAGHEVYENPEAQVFLRRIVPHLATSRPLPNPDTSPGPVASQAASCSIS